jgi:energy-coupling factor transporter ATP-binding protein EcfA2
MSNDVIISLEDVSYAYGQQPAIRNVSLAIRRGTLTIVVGPSGSGKTTLCDVLAGIPHVYGGRLSGKAVVDGLDLGRAGLADIARKVGKVFQDPEVMAAMLEVEDEIAFGPENMAIETGAIGALVEECLTWCDLHPVRHNLVWELSGGQIQKLGLAAILAMQPPVIILDEPTANLDPLATRAVHDLVLQLRRQGTTVLLVTKELDEFLAQADQLLVMEGGELALAGPPQAVIDAHGARLLEELGIWLPEPCEIGLGLRAAGLLNGRSIPLTVRDTLGLVQDLGIRFSGSNGRCAPRAAAPESPVLACARGLRHTYGRSEALKGTDFEIRQGELLTIVGRNGAGKSTLSRLLTGLLKPEKGQLQLFGRDAAHWRVGDLAHKVGLVFQNPEHQFLTDTVFDEIAYGCRQAGEDEEEVARKVGRLLARLDLEDVAGAHPFSLSAGKKRRLGVAAMLVGSPELLIVDEPTYGQDRAMTRSLMELMLELKEAGITIVMITHDMRLVQEYGERVLVMNEGEIVFDGPVTGLFARPEILERASLAAPPLQELLVAWDHAGASRNVAALLEHMVCQGEMA